MQRRHRLRPGRGGLLRCARRAAGRRSRLAHRRRGCRRVFAEPVRAMKPGDVSACCARRPAFTSSSCSETRSRNAPTVVEQTHARHILIKVNEITSEAEGEGARSSASSERIETGAKFEDQAKLNSEDASVRQGRRSRLDFAGRHGARFRGGDEQAQDRRDLGPGALAVRLAPDPGAGAAHAGHHRGAPARPGAQAMRQRKSDEAFQDWLRQMRDRAYVEIKLDESSPRSGTASARLSCPSGRRTAASRTRPSSIVARSARSGGSLSHQIARPFFWSSTSCGFRASSSRMNVVCSET